MNIKEIAKLTGKSERTIRRWISSPSDKMTGSSEIMSGLSVKIAEAQFNKLESQEELEKELQMLLITQTLARVKASIRLNGSENAAWILKHL